MNKQEEKGLKVLLIIVFCVGALVGHFFTAYHSNKLIELKDEVILMQDSLIDAQRDHIMKMNRIKLRYD